MSGDQRAAAAVLLLLSPDCTLTHVSTSHCLVRDGELKYSNQLCSRRRILTIECSCEPDQDMSQQCTGAGSLALAHQQTALHCYCWWCKGHVRVYNCAGMSGILQIFYRIPLILLPQPNTQSPAELHAVSSHLCPVLRSVTVC